MNAAPAAPAFVVDDGEFLQLHFSMRFIQSRMSLREPFRLSLDYTRRMMACLLFQPDPMQVEIVGLGGGSLTKFCYRGFPHAQVTSIEVDQNVIAMSPLFQVPPPSARLSIVHADAADYFARSQRKADLVLVDGCDADGIAPSLMTSSFFVSVHQRLRTGGVAVFNLVGSKPMKAEAQRRIADVFADRVLLLNVAVGGNRIALAFKDRVWPPDWQAIRRVAPQLASRYRLDLESDAEALERGYRYCRRRPDR